MSSTLLRLFSQRDNLSQANSEKLAARPIFHVHKKHTIRHSVPVVILYLCVLSGDILTTFLALMNPCPALPSRILTPQITYKDEKMPVNVRLFFSLYCFSFFTSRSGLEQNTHVFYIRQASLPAPFDSSV